MSAALYRDAFTLHQAILISVAENDHSSPVRTGSYKSSAMLISAALEPVLTGDFKSFATVIGALLEPADGRFQELCNGDQCVVGARPDGRFAAQFITYW
jgi:hypothetical protein